MKNNMRGDNLSGETFQLTLPCFGFFLQGGVKALALADVGVQISMIVCVTTGIAGMIKGGGFRNLQDLEFPARFGRIFLWIYIYLYHFVTLVYTRTLYTAADKRDLNALQTWFRNSCFLLLPYFILYLAITFWLKWSHEYGAAVFAGYQVYRYYAFWVTYRFIQEIKYYGCFNSALRQLTDELVQNFFYGHPSIPPESEETTLTNFKSLPYREDMEIPQTRIKVDEKGPLGSGAFGTVYKAQLLPKDGDPFFSDINMIVAVKTVDPNSDICFIKALLSELKLLSYVGRHENVVCLIGACTSEIRKREVYLVMEFCQLGSLSNYLRANKGRYFPVTQDSNRGILSEYIFQKSADNLTFIDLLTWSMQTASGMDFISKKKVIHGDLAARNVMLTDEKVAKIGDFGLSRQLYHYSCYIKQNEEPLPWRWMSPESLRDLSFSTASDVWSFGVTLWEYFTCSEIPYSGYSYSMEFVKQLSTGLRLQKPHHATEEMYAKFVEMVNDVVS